MNSFKKSLKKSLHFAVIFLALTVFTGCVSESDDTGSDEESKSGTPVSTVKVKTKTLEETLSSVGTLRADQTVRITPEIAAPIEQIQFQEGEVIEEDDVLVRLDKDKLREQFQARKHALDEAQAQLTNAERTYNRNKRLHEQDMISSQQFDDSREAYKSAQARVERLKSEVQEARELLSDATIRAPFTGYLGSREVDAGNYVQPGTHLTTLYRLDPLEARFTVPERFSGRIQTDQSVRVHVSAYPDTAFTGKIFFVSPSVREQTRDMLVKARVKNPDRILKPGTFARIETIVRTLENRPVVPARALISTREGYVVFVVKDGKAVRTPVSIGLRKPEHVEIRDGLKAGDIVISSGHMSVSNGSSVELMNDQSDVN